MALKSARAGQTFAHQWWTTNCVSILVFFACSFSLCCCISHWFSHLIFCLNVFFFVVHSSIDPFKALAGGDANFDWLRWSARVFGGVVWPKLTQAICFNFNRRPLQRILFELQQKNMKIVPSKKKKRRRHLKLELETATVMNRARSVCA